jgi:hypothetical protein
MLRRPWVTRAALGLAAALTLGAMSSSAAAASSNTAATHAYIRANYAFLSVGEADVSAAVANAKIYIHKIEGECPAAGNGAPQDGAAQHMSLEAAGAIWSVTNDIAPSASQALLRKLDGLHWSNPKLTRMARRYAHSMYELSRLPTPPLCADVRAWSASGFSTVPTDTLSYDRHVESIEGQAIPPRLLAPFVRANDRATLARMKRLERKLEEAEIGQGFDEWDALLETLGLNQ